MSFSVTWFDTLPSTNAYLKERLRSGDPVPDGLAVAARCQTDGRGRQGRVWLSSPGRDLAFSVWRRWDAPPHDVDAQHRLAALPMAAALAVRDMLESLGVVASVKWPNDVLVTGRKISGILQEVIATPSGRAIVLGIGVNVNMRCDEAARVERSATSLAIETGRDHAVDEVLRHLLPLLSRRMEVWSDAGFAGLRAEWTRHAPPVGTAIRLRSGETGTLAGWGESGELLLDDPSCGLRAFWSAEIE